MLASFFILNIMYYVYYTYKNDEPDKAYVGMTIKPIESGYKGSGILIKNVLRKNGKANFTRANLCEFENKDECHFWEGFYIRLYKTEKKYGGYNISPAGGLGSSSSWSEEMRDKLRGKNNPMYGKPFPAERWQSHNRGPRKPMTQETKDKIRKTCSESHKRLWEKYRFPDISILRYGPLTSI